MILGQEKSKRDIRNCIKLYLKSNIFVSIDEYKGKWKNPDAEHIETLDPKIVNVWFEQE